MKRGDRIERRGTLGAPAEAGNALPLSTLSTDEPQRRGWGWETLSHDPAAVDLSRAQTDGLPIFIAHEDKQLPVGRMRHVRLEGGKLVGVPFISEATQIARDVRGLIDDGTLVDLSIGAKLTENPEIADHDGELHYIVRGWIPKEVSVLGYGLDSAAGIGRDDEGNTMDPTAPTTGTDTAPASPAPPLSVVRGDDAEHDRVQSHFRQAQLIIDGVPELADAARELRDRLVLERTGVDDAHPLWQQLVSRPRDVSIDDGLPSFRPGEDQSDKLMRGMEEALCVRAGLPVEGDAGANPFTSYTLVEMARTFAERGGIDVTGLGRTELVRRVIQRSVDGPAANDSSTYPLLLESVLRKSLYAGYMEHPSTWQVWCQVGRVEDYKEFSRPGLSHFQDLAVVAENGEFLEGTFAEKAEKGTMVKYGRRYSISLEAQINDDLGAFNDKGPKMGQAAARLTDSLPYALLVSNPTMGEIGRGTLFSATPGAGQNQYTAAISEDSIQANRVATVRRVDPNNVKIFPQLQYILHPPELSKTVEKLLVDTQVPVAVGGVGAAREHNTVANRYTSVESAWLTDPTDWYSAATTGTIEMVFLDGMQTPQLEREQGFKHDVLWLKVRHNVVALATDWRGLNANIVAG